jgi:hypothetical protein
METSTAERLRTPLEEAAMDLANERYSPDDIVKAFILERSTIFRELNAIRIKVRGDFQARSKYPVMTCEGVE